MIDLGEAFSAEKLYGMVARVLRFSAVGVGRTFMGGDGFGESDMTASESSASVESTSAGLKTAPTCFRDMREARLDDLSSAADRELRCFTALSVSVRGKRRGGVLEVVGVCGSSIEVLDVEGNVNMPS
jgi:hypothetical protein